MKGAQKVIAVDGISFEVKKGKPSDWSENPAVEKYTWPHDFTDL